MVLVLLAGVIYAQKGKVTAALNFLETDNLEKALEAVQMAEEHEKSKDWFRTYYAKGRVYQAIYESGDEGLLKQVENPLETAYQSYQKAIELDDKGRVGKQIDLFLQPLLNDFLNQGIEAFNDQDYKTSYHSFVYAVKVGQAPIFGGDVDTSLVYNVGLAAYNANMYDEAIESFQEVAALGYEEGTPYILIKNAYIAQGDSANALAALQKGFEHHPENENLVIELINYYLLSGGDDQALEYISIAIRDDPENASFWHAQGVLYDKKGMAEKAIESYTRSVELNPDNFESYYNLGALYFNKGVTMANDALEIQNPDEYAKALDKADVEFNRSLPWLEKAHELKDDDMGTMETLRILYYRLKMMDKHATIEKKMGRQ